MGRLVELGARFPRSRRSRRALRQDHRLRSEQPRLLRRVRLLEARLHPRGCLCPLSRRRARSARSRGAGAVQGSGGQRRSTRCSHAGAPAMTDPYTILGGTPPPLDHPTMVVMLTGWIDASGAAAAAMAALDEESHAEVVATFDGDTFIDYRARRPTMELREGVNSNVVWPSIEVKAG